MVVLAGCGFVSQLRYAIIGLIIGIASITPGMSGGALAAALGLYERMVQAISHPLRDLRRNLVFLLPVGIGAAVGVVGFSNVMEWLMQQAPNQVKWLFLGLVAGSVPSLMRTANSKGFHWRWLLYTLVALASLPLFNLLQQSWSAVTAPGGSSGWMAFLGYGLMLAVGTIVPGISTSFILMAFGVYDQLLRAMATLDLEILFPTGLGFCLGVLLLARLVEMLFRRFHSQAYYTVLGFLLGSALLILPSPVFGWPLLLDIGLFVLGVSISLLMLRLSPTSQS